MYQPAQLCEHKSPPVSLTEPGSPSWPALLGVCVPFHTSCARAMVLKSLTVRNIDSLTTFSSRCPKVRIRRLLVDPARCLLDVFLRADSPGADPAEAVLPVMSQMSIQMRCVKSGVAVRQSWETTAAAKHMRASDARDRCCKTKSEAITRLGKNVAIVFKSELGV